MKDTRFERLCFEMRLFEGQEAEYERRHRELWPEMHDALKRSGYANYTLFRRGTTVVGYAECSPDVETAAARMAAEPVNERWNESFRQIIVPSSPEGAYALALETIWHID